MSETQRFPLGEQACGEPGDAEIDRLRLESAHAEIARLRMTGAEREAVEKSERWARLEGYDKEAATLRGLLERLK